MTIGLRVQRSANWANQAFINLIRDNWFCIIPNFPCHILKVKGEYWDNKMSMLLDFLWIKEESLLHIFSRVFLSWFVWNVRFIGMKCFEFIGRFGSILFLLYWPDLSANLKNNQSLFCWKEEEEGMSMAIFISRLFWRQMELSGTLFQNYHGELDVGIEPTTVWLKVKCSTHWANQAIL